MTLTQRISDQATAAFRRQLFQRWVEGDYFHAGEYRIYTDGYTIKERKVKPADYQAVRTELMRAARETVACAHCKMTATRLERSMSFWAQTATDKNPLICCEIPTLPTAQCQHLTTVTNGAGSPVCQDCGTSW